MPPMLLVPLRHLAEGSRRPHEVGIMASSTLQAGRLRLGGGCSSLPRPHGPWVTEALLNPGCRSFAAHKGQGSPRRCRRAERVLHPHPPPCSPLPSTRLLWSLCWCLSARGLRLHHWGRGSGTHGTPRWGHVWLVPEASLRVHPLLASLSWQSGRPGTRGASRARVPRPAFKEAFKSHFLSCKEEDANAEPGCSVRPKT